VSRHLFTVALLLLVSTGICSAFHYYPNPGWKQGEQYRGWNGSDLRLSRPRLQLYGTVSPDFADGIGYGAFYMTGADFKISRFVNLKTSLRLGRNIPRLDSLAISMYMQPLHFLALSIGYTVRPLSRFGINEHNLVLLAAFPLDFLKMPRWFDMELDLGFVFRFIDLDSRNSRIGPIINEYFMIWRTLFSFHPHNVYSIGFELGNFTSEVIETLNYWRLVVNQDFHLPGYITVFFNAGFSMAGSLPFAGIVYRGFVETGVRYAITF
jgi:hypothetical protein